MAFDVRCPECKAKLRLDEAPDPDTPIECPRCGSQFGAPEDKPAPKPAKKSKGDKKKKGADGEKKPGSPVKRKALKKKTNPFLLVGLVLFAFGGLVVVGFLLVWLSTRTGAIEEMLTYAPESCNWARGVNVGTLAKYPGYATEADKFLTGDVRWASDDFAAAAGHDKETFLTYFIALRSRQDSGPGGMMYVFRTTKAFKPDDVGANLKGARDNGDGSYSVSGSGIMNGALVHMPTNRLIVLVPAGPQQRQLMSGSLAARGGKKEGTFAQHLDTTGRLVVRGTIWLLIRQTGALKTYAGDSLTSTKEGLKSIYDRATKSTGMFGVWTSPGGNGVRFGAAMQCQSSSEASDLVKAMQGGALGKADESEPPNDLRQGLSMVADKKLWGEMMQSLDFKSTKECAYIVATVTGDNSKRVMGVVNSSTMGTGTGFAGGGGFAPPGGGGGPPGGGPPGGGPPGGKGGPTGGFNPPGGKR